MSNNWKEYLPKDNIYFETDNGILYCDDSHKLLKQIPDEFVDLVITDPPYGVGSHETNGINYRDEFYDADTISRELYRILKNNSRCYVFSAQQNLCKVIDYFTRNNFTLHQILVWHKPNLAGGTKKKVYEFTSVYENILNFHKGKPNKLKRLDGINNIDVLKYTQPQSNYKVDKRYHIHQKPIKLIEHLLLVSIDNNDCIVIDPFAGAGTTCLIAEKHNIKWIGIEIQPEYCEIAKYRIENNK